MRLLNISGGQFEYVENNEGGADQEPYIILSHKWYREHELRYSDYPFDRVSRSREYGLEKLKRLARIARNGIDGRFDKVEHVWMDTVCVNQKDKAEVDSSLKAMFEWYESAEACLVFLPDVHHVPSKKRDQMSSADRRKKLDRVGQCAHYYRKEFSESKWFRRGWTLQELLAPENVFFYNTSFELIGHKDQKSAPIMFELIRKATKIPASVLTGKTELTECSVAQKISWMAKRTTDRPEDSAYCLQGICNVSIAVEYGEGLEAAFAKLQIAIMESQLDHTILCWDMPELHCGATPEERARHHAQQLKPPFLSPTPRWFDVCSSMSWDRECHSSQIRISPTNGGRMLEFELPENLFPKNPSCWMYLMRLPCQTILEDGEQFDTYCKFWIIQDKHPASQLSGVRSGLLFLKPGQEEDAMQQALGWKYPADLCFDYQCMELWRWANNDDDQFSGLSKLDSVLAETKHSIVSKASDLPSGLRTLHRALSSPPATYKVRCEFKPRYPVAFSSVRTR